MNENTRHYGISSGLMIIAAACILAALITGYWRFTVDDAFITFRYSENLARGLAPTYNISGLRAEGYTSFLWMLLMAIPHLARVDAVPFSKIMGIAATLACIFFSWKLVYRFAGFPNAGRSHLPAAFTVLIIASLPSTAVHAVSGMETALFAMFMVLFMYLCMDFIDKPGRTNASLLSLSALMLGLSRPEGNLVAAAALVWVYFHAAKPDRARIAKAASLFYILPGAVYFAWRVHYYGHLMPLPFYSKVYSQSTFAGLSDVAKFIIDPKYGIMLALGMGGIGRRSALLFVPVVAMMLFFIFPAHIMDYHYRYLFPVVPLIVVAAVIGALRLVSLSAHLKGLRPGVVTVSSILIAFALVLTLTDGARSDMLDKKNYAHGMDTTHIALGKKLAEIADDGVAPVLAISDAGAVPYYSGWKTVDTFGLNFPPIAITGSHDPEMVLLENPDLVVLLSRTMGEFDEIIGWERPLYERCLAGGMVNVKTLHFGSYSYYLWLLSKPGSRVADHLEKWEQPS